MRPERIHAHLFVGSQLSKEATFVVIQLSIIEASVFASVLKCCHDLIKLLLFGRPSRLEGSVFEFGTWSIPCP